MVHILETIAYAAAKNAGRIVAFLLGGSDE